MSVDFKDVLILTSKNSSLVGKTLMGYGVKVESIWKNDHYSSRKFKLLSMIGQEHLLFGFKKEDILEHNKIIISENNRMGDIVKFIRKYNEHCDIKIYLWTPINKKYKKEVELLKDMNVDIYSFDMEDCKRYKLYYNHQPVSYLNKIKNITEKIEYDCYFCGSDKNRIDEIIRIKNMLMNDNITFKIKVLIGKKNLNVNLKDIDLLHKEISYDEILNETKKAKCILEIIQEGQSGWTLRTMEALFLDKKLITNNKNIKNFDFYNPSNIFVLDNNYEEIKTFLNIPYINVSEEIKQRYSFESWIENFFK